MKASLSDDEGRVLSGGTRAVVDRRKRRRGAADSESPSEHAVIFVCAANVCRSPLMAYSFEEAARSTASGSWNVSSGGMNAKAPLEICDVAEGILLEHGVDAEVLSSHRALRVMADHLDRQDLIITASKDERAAIAMIRPGLRSRTFTLNEAVALGAASPTASELQASATAMGSDAGLLAQYAGVLHLRRGTILVAPPLAPSRRRRLRRVEPDPQDIPDVHHLRRRPHTATLSDAWQSTQRLHDQVQEFLKADARR